MDNKSFHYIIEMFSTIFRNSPESLLAVKLPAVELLSKENRYTVNKSLNISRKAYQRIAYEEIKLLKDEYLAYQRIE